MIGVIVGSLIVERQLKHRGEKGDRIRDALIWVLPAGIIGARLWYVLNATLGGNRYYIENPVQIINVPQGGLHIFGGLLLGAAALLYYLRQNKLDVWLFLDAAGPAILIGQAIGRIANFINQELYGHPRLYRGEFRFRRNTGFRSLQTCQIRRASTRHLPMRCCGISLRQDFC